MSQAGSPPHSRLPDANQTLLDDWIFEEAVATSRE